MRTEFQLLLFCLAVVGAGCADSAKCSEGETLVGAICWVDGDGDGALAGNGDAGTGDAGFSVDASMRATMDADAAAPNDDTDDEADMARPSADEGFGDPCSDGTDHGDCTDTADYCAVMPGAAQGSCTATGCSQDELRCPDGWGCLDLSIFQPDLPSVCTTPMR